MDPASTLKHRVVSKSSGARTAALQVDDPRAAAVFVDRTQRRYLAPFMTRPCATAEAARELGISVSRMGYQVRKLLHLGLIRDVPQALGTTVRRYQAAATRFVVPLSAVPSDDMEALYRRFSADRRDEQLKSVVNEALRLATAWQIVYPEHPGADRAVIEPATGAGTMDLGVVDHGWTLALTQGEAARMQRELLDVVARYAQRPHRSDVTDNTDDPPERFLLGLTLVRHNDGRRDRKRRPRAHKTPR